MRGKAHANINLRHFERLRAIEGSADIAGEFEFPLRLRRVPVKAVQEGDVVVAVRGALILQP